MKNRITAGLSDNTEKMQGKNGQKPIHDFDKIVLDALCPKWREFYLSFGESEDGSQELADKFGISEKEADEMQNTTGLIWCNPYHSCEPDQKYFRDKLSNGFFHLVMDERQARLFDSMSNTFTEKELIARGTELSMSLFEIKEVLSKGIIKPIGIDYFIKSPFVTRQVVKMTQKQYAEWLEFRSVSGRLNRVSDDQSAYVRVEFEDPAIGSSVNTSFTKEDGPKMPLKIKLSREQAENLQASLSILLSK